MGWLRTLRRLHREMARYRRAAPKLLSLGWRDWSTLVRAQAALLRAQRDLRRRPVGEFVRDGNVSPPASAAIAPERRDEVRRLALAISRVASYGLIRPKCLVQSMGLRQLTEDAGISGATVRVGVQVVNGRFIAHAWVDYAGEVFGDDPKAVARYVPLNGIQLVEFE